MVETTATAAVYGFLGLYSSKSVALAVPIAPAVLLGLPLGAYFVRYVRVESFRRICMSFDAWVVGFGLARTIIDLALLPTRMAYAVWCAIIILDGCLLYQYFALGRFRAKVEPFSNVETRRRASS
jgi:hypothetical protein